MKKLSTSGSAFVLVSIKTLDLVFWRINDVHDRFKSDDNERQSDRFKTLVEDLLPNGRKKNNASISMVVERLA